MSDVKFKDLAARLAEELGEMSKTYCWSGQFPSCVNEGCKERAALLAEAATALAPPPPSKWEIRQAATGGGPCERCTRPRYIHSCISCSPSGDTPGPGCGDCRNTGWDQTPCLPPHRWTAHGWQCCNQAESERPQWVKWLAKCAGPGVCGVCTEEVSKMAGHAAIARGSQPAVSGEAGRG